MKIDINCDMGESFVFLNSGHDESLMHFISSVNIACGYHAGNSYIMEKTVENALKFDLKIGAHPSFNDKENFGRNEVTLTTLELKDLFSSQLEILNKIIIKNGSRMNHVKPHGALYNMSAVKNNYAKAVAEAVWDFDPSLILFGLSGSQSIKEASKLGLSTYNECFVDRAYHADGTLVNRKLPNAVKNDIEEIKKQAHCFLNGLEIRTYENELISLKCDTICLHSDTPNSLNFAKALYQIIS